MPGLMALRERVRRRAAARRRAHHRLAAHDHPDRGAHRDARRARRRGALGVAATSSRPRTTRPPPSRRPTARRRPAGVPVFAWKGETLEEYWWCTEQALRWPGRRRPQHDPRRRRRRHAARAQGRRVREGRRGARPVDRPTPRSSRSSSTLLRRTLAEDPTAVDAHRRRHQGRHRGDHHRRAPALPDARGRHAAVPGDQRQRLGHQVEVRQPLRLPALARSTASTAPPT